MQSQEVGLKILDLGGEDRAFIFGGELKVVTKESNRARVFQFKDRQLFENGVAPQEMLAEPNEHGLMLMAGFDCEGEEPKNIVCWFAYDNSEPAKIFCKHWHSKLKRVSG